MRRFAPTLLVLGACNSGVQPTAASTSTPTPAVILPVAPDPVAKGIPHGSQIIDVAVTDDGDAAITFDNMLGVRLWPTLDGSRPPIPLTVEAPRKVSIAHEGRDLLVAIMSDAGSVRVMQLGHDGRVRSSVSLPGQYLQAIAIDGGVLVRTADHAVERYAVDGTLHGRLVADPGKQIVTIVTRNGHNAVLFANAELGTSREVRRVVIDDGISWGATIELSSAVHADQIALSPNGRRIAYGTIAHKLEVWEVEPFKREISGYTTTVEENARGLGFLDDTHVAIAGSPNIQMWTELEKPTSKEADPWAVGSQMSPSLPQPKDQSFLMDGFAVADGKVLTGLGVVLALSSLDKVQYLGFKQLPLGTVAQVGNEFAMTMSTSRFVWLDGKLVMQRDEDLKGPLTSSWMYAIPIDSTHVVQQTNFEGRYDFSLVDVTTKDKIEIAKFRDVDRMQYDQASHLFGIKEGKKLHRYAFDGHTMTPLPDIKVKTQATSFMLFDSAKANGIAAAVVGWDNDYSNYETLTIYRDNGKTTRVHPFTGSIAATSPDGTLYATEAGAVRIYRDGAKKPTVIKLPDSVFFAVTSDGSHIAYTTRDELIVTDAKGTAQWRQPQWASNQLMFSADGKTLLVRGTGGFASYDTASGARLARECGWSFGLYDEALDGTAANAAPMCEDPMLQ